MADPRRRAARTTALLWAVLVTVCAPLGGAMAATADVDKAPDSIAIYFGSGSVHIRPAEAAKLDEAAHLYREGKPLLMTVSGGADGVGDPIGNLRISQRRADAVFQGLVARGIPAERFQVIAKGETQPAIPVSPGAAEPKDRVAVITWK